jgi:hypothetical protein
VSGNAQYGTVLVFEVAGYAYDGDASAMTVVQSMRTIRWSYRQLDPRRSGDSDADPQRIRWFSLRCQFSDSILMSATPGLCGLIHEDWI